jgi:hypothetical protein
VTRDASIVLPVVIGCGAIACTIVIHAAALIGNLHFIRRQRAKGRFGAGFWRDLEIVGAAVLVALAAHLIEIGLWAFVLVAVGEFQRVELAFYHSAMNYTTLGYGDIVMSPAWKLLGPLEAADGLLMFGVSTAMIFAVVQRLTWARFPDLRA